MIAAARTEAELAAHVDVPFDALRAEMGVAAPVYETVLDPTDPGRDPEEGQLLTLAAASSREGLALVLCYRTEALDAALPHASPATT